MTSAEGAPERYDAAALLELLVDSRTVADVQRRYGGRHDVRDALWWRSRPGAPAPSGALDPRLHRDRLAAVAYGRDGSPEDLRDLVDVESALARDESMLDALLADAATIVPPHSEAMHPAAATDATGQSVAEQSEAEQSVADVAGTPRAARRWPVVVTAVAVVALAATSAMLGVRLFSAEASLSGAPPTTGADPLALFDREQAVDDVPDASLPYDYEPASIRRLLRPDQVGLSDDYVLYGARTDREEVCLVLVLPDANTASSCVSLAEYRRNGVRVSANVLRTSRESLGSRIPVAHTVTWQSNGAFQFSSALAGREP